jgi:phenylacetate-CoA ligase
MKRLAVDLYHRLPTQLRSLSASAYGYYVRAWRYGADFEARVNAALERDSWSSEQWHQWQQGRLRELLDRAATQVPFYRRYWAHRDRAAWRNLANWPILEKEQLRKFGAALVAEGCRRRQMSEEQTSGTTGTPLRLWASRETLRQWYALFEARGRSWYGVTRHDRWAILGGQLIKPVAETRPPFWVWNRAARQLYMSVYHLAPNRIAAYLDALAAYRVRYLYGYTSALHELACEVIRRGGVDVRLHVVITNAEPVLPHQREAIEQAFGCPLRETYGMAEMCGAASQCEAGSLHLWPDAGLLEVLDGREPVSPGETGDLVFTGLINLDMPLIRYRVGDRGALAPSDACGCGRLLPQLAGVDGRCDDVLYSTRGDRIGRLDPVFKAELPLKMAQIVQDSLTGIRVRYVPAPGFEQRHMGEIERHLLARLGPVSVTFEEVADIPRTAAGKRRAVICNLPESVRRNLSPLCDVTRV